MGILLSLIVAFELQHCDMTYMRPNYHLEYQSTYSVYEYFDKNYKYDEYESILLFLPGNKGSYEQVRSIGSELLKIQAVKVFTFDFNEEFSVFSYDIIYEQALFIVEYLNHIKQSRQGKSIDIVAHSMGAFALRLALELDPSKMQLIDTIVTLASPQDPPTPIDNRLYHIKPLMNPISVFGGYRDKQVAPHLYSNSYSTYELVSTGADHLAILWCNQLIKKLALFLKNSTQLVPDITLGKAKEVRQIAHYKQYLSSEPLIVDLYSKYLFQQFSNCTLHVIHGNSSYPVTLNQSHINFLSSTKVYIPPYCQTTLSLNFKFIFRPFITRYSLLILMSHLQTLQNGIFLSFLIFLNQLYGQEGYFDLFWMFILFSLTSILGSFILKLVYKLLSMITRLIKLKYNWYFLLLCPLRHILPIISILYVVKSSNFHSSSLFCLLIHSLQLIADYKLVFVWHFEDLIKNILFGLVPLFSNRYMEISALSLSFIIFKEWHFEYIYLAQWLFSIATQKIKKQ